MLNVLHLLQNMYLPPPLYFSSFSYRNYTPSFVIEDLTRYKSTQTPIQKNQIHRGLCKKTMVGAEIEGSTSTNNAYANGLVQINNGSLEEKLDELHHLLGKTDDDPLRIVSVGAGAWGSVFAAMLQDGYGHLRDKVQIRIWR